MPDLTPPPMFPDRSPTPSARLSFQETGRNLRSAGNAAAALEVAVDDGLSASEAISDLVGHMRHLADCKGVGWSAIAGPAEDRFYDQTRGEGSPVRPGPGLSPGRPVAAVRKMPAVVTYLIDEAEVRRQNLLRADKAAAAIRCFGSEADVETGMVDLLAGLRHLAAQSPGVDWAEVEATTEMHYHAEIRGEP